ncbi:von Willebrand factor D and EGF domain-containing protein-like [Argopecten irradians]|uniref:von Willebrand factor D and EGF domain-containing protein-like n=1 Tax=Argopecten irradians TaxID=31199 RepID=UPI0037237891
MFYSVCIYLSLLTFTSNGQSADPCHVKNHQLLNDPLRSTAVSAGEIYPKDALLTDGWYRSVSGAGGTIPQTAPESGQCNTGYPVWMNDTLPNSNEIKSAKMCAVSVYDDCSPTWDTVKVKNCDDLFYVYYLTRPPGNYGYCFGNKIECPNGETSETGFWPGCTSILKVDFSVTIKPGLHERRGPLASNNRGNFINLEIKFEHDITFSNSTVDPADYLYDVDWYINSHKLTDCSHREISFANLSPTHLMEPCWRTTFNLNFLARCEIRIRYGTNLTIFISSDVFEAGFKTDKKSYTVAENEFIVITITLTVPLGCAYLPTTTQDDRHEFAEEHCTTQLTIRTPYGGCISGDDSNEPVSFTNSFCGVTISHNDWDRPKFLMVFGDIDNKVNSRSRSSNLRLKFPESVIFHHAYRDASMPDVLVIVKDEDYHVSNKECSSVNDPHMKTFDGKKWENQRLGEYVLYHNKERHYWVHVMYQNCAAPYHKASCNCGVAIRSNQALFVANFCDRKIGWRTSSTQSNRYIQQSFCDDTHMLINKKGNSYTVTLPRGTQISFSHSKCRTCQNERRFIDFITVKPSLTDLNVSSGLCGYMDGNPSNDFRLRNGRTTVKAEEFALDWKVSNDSLFGDVDLRDEAFDLPRYCKCRSAFRNEDFNNEVLCNITETPPCTVTNTDSFFPTCDEPSRRKRSTAHNRYRRDLIEHDAPPKFKIEFDSDADEEPEPPVWENGWNETSAEEACRSFITNQIFLEICEEVLPETAINNEEGIQTCIKDIKLTGDNSFMQSTVNNLAESCRLTALKLENLTQTTADSSTANDETVLEYMLKLDCRNNCSGNGVCKEGECECFGDFEGEECDSRPSQPPVVSSQTNPGLCKRDVYACNTFYVSGSNFAESNMTCKASHFTISANGYRLTSLNDTFPARYVGGGFGCTCTLSDALRREKTLHRRRIQPNEAFHR